MLAAQLCDAVNDHDSDWCASTWSPVQNRPLDPKASFVTADSGQPDQHGREAQFQRGHPGWRHVPTLGFSLAGGGHDPFTWKVSDHGSACMATMARAVGFQSRT